MISVKVFETSPVEGKGLESLIASVVPKLVETYSFKEDDRAAIQDLFSIYDKEKYMIVVKYREPSELGQKWMEFSMMYGGLASQSNVLDYIIGKA